MAVPMFLKASLMAFLVGFCLCQAGRVQVGVDVHEEYWLARGLVNTGRAAADLIVPFSVAMRQQNLDQLRSNLVAVSTPSSPTYRQFLTAEEVAALVATSQEDIALVYQWLVPIDPKKNCNIGATRDVLHCFASVEELEALFETELFALDREGGSSAATISHVGRLSIPAFMADAVDLIQGISVIPYRKAGRQHATVFGTASDQMEEFVSSRSFAARKLSKGASISSIRGVLAANSTCPSSSPVGCLSASGASQEFCCPEATLCCPNINTGGACCEGGLSCCNGECVDECSSDDDGDNILVTPQVLRDQYNVDPSATASQNLFNQSVVAFTDEYSSGALDFFNTVFGERQVPVTRYGPAGCLPKCDQVESDLDMQYMSSMGSGVGQWFWYNSDGYTLEWAQAVLALENPPLVHSISYISGEYQLGEEYILRSNDEIMKMGNIGASVMACSGDTGSPGWSINFPIDPRARNFPISCPDCPTYVNLCNQITLSLFKRGSQHLCNMPSGMYSRDASRVLPCDIISANADCEQALEQFEETNSGSCGFEIVQDVEGIPRLFTEDCSCSELTPVTVGNCTVSGFNFDPANGSPITSLYPASCPYATAVGATQLSDKTSAACGQRTAGLEIQCDVGEVACSIAGGAFITSGGGFSTISDMQSYQTDAVATYLGQNVPLPDGFYDSSKRAYPDVAFLGHNFVVAASVNSTESCPCTNYVVDGTSCSSPGFAGLVSQLNQASMQMGNPPMGFLNPWLYSLPDAAFYDVTSGDNYCTEELCSFNIGYVATNGWDPVSGRGTPNLEVMLEYIV